MDRPKLGNSLVLAGFAIGLASLTLPAGRVVGAPIRGYTLLLASLASFGGPFKGWQDAYIALAGVANVALFVVLPVGLVRESCRAPLAVAACLSVVYALTVPSVLDLEPSAAFYAWIIAIAFATSGYVRLAWRSA